MRFSENRIEKLTCSDGIKRDIHIWEPEKPRAVFLTVHGGGDYGGNYCMPGLYFRKHRIVTVAHDQHGHDMKKKVHVPRFEVFLDDLELMVEWVKEHYSSLPIFILSHSVGGLESLQFGVRRIKDDPVIRGYIMSSPYFAEPMKALWLLRGVLKPFSILTPRIAVPVGDQLHHVTHDEDILRRYREDQRDNIMSSKGSVRFGHELFKALRTVPNLIVEWEHPLLVIFAGKDMHVDVYASRKLIGLIDPDLVTEHFYPDNYHDNFNELNREEIFEGIMKWVEPKI